MKINYYFKKLLPILLYDQLTESIPKEWLDLHSSYSQLQIFQIEIIQVVEL